MLYPPRCPFCGEIITENRGIKNTAAAQSNKMRYRRGTQKDRHCICTECNQTLPYIGEQRCMKCGKPVPMEEQEYCTDCAKHKLAFEQGRSLWVHTGSVMQAVYRFKFYNKRYYIRSSSACPKAATRSIPKIRCPGFASWPSLCIAATKME